MAWKQGDRLEEYCLNSGDKSYVPYKLITGYRGNIIGYLMGWGELSLKSVLLTVWKSEEEKNNATSPT